MNIHSLMTPPRTPPPLADFHVSKCLSLSSCRLCSYYCLYTFHTSPLFLPIDDAGFSKGHQPQKLLSVYMYMYIFTCIDILHTYIHAPKKDQGFSSPETKTTLPGSAVLLLLLLLLLLLPVRQNTVQSYNNGTSLHPSWYLRATDQTRDTFMSHSRRSDCQNRSYSVHGLPSEGVRYTGVYLVSCTKRPGTKTRYENDR